MLKYMPILVLVMVWPLMASTQEFNSDELKRLESKEKEVIVVSQKSINVIQKVNKLDPDQAAEGLAIMLEHGKNNLDKNDQVLVAMLTGGFHLRLGNQNEALEQFKFLLAHERVTKDIEISALISTAIAYHNKKEYLNAIRYINHWLVYNAAQPHHVGFMLANSYLEIGDTENAYRSYLKAKDTYDKYLSGGPDFEENVEILDFYNIIEKLNDKFEGLEPQDVPKSNITIDIPPPGDAFWAIEFNPKYPTAALRRTRTGHAIMKFDLKGNGKIENVEILETSNSLFKRAANSHARKMIFLRYAPTDEEVIARDVIYKLNFVYQGL